MSHARPVINIVSGGMGTSAEQIIHTALAQFGGHTVDISKNSHIRSRDL